MSADVLKIGVLGLGTVGSATVQTLLENQAIIAARAGKRIEVVIGATREPEKSAHLGIRVTDDVNAVLTHPEVEVVVELMGGVDFAYACVKQALLSGKSVVTANKAMLAYHRGELEQLARNLHFGYEASVAGGIPVIYALRDGLSANHIQQIRGIVNGTCNYILTRMMHEGADFGEVLQDAQRLGYAEANPSADVGGFDAAHKLLILASIAYGIDAKPEEILIEGIEAVSAEDIAFAKEFGYVIKLLAIAKKQNDHAVELRVHPCLVPESHILADVDGVMNGVAISGDRVGETMFYGAGAGGNATASAVVANLIEIARSPSAAAMMGFNQPLERGLALAPKDAGVSPHYLRIAVADEVGVLARVASIMASSGISIENVMQRPLADGGAGLYFTTHDARESAIRTAMEALSQEPFVKAPPTRIRIER